ncbi:DinB family protein [Neolewinella lacunae]|uniref:DinB family protein n=1 Tax=Neolewinella lacunae TaxID=1517758 RepID=A0A923PPC4_9BACT|nr:DinB family protein [Neolewinella lacunae]MBC6996411.1 DinB family protein [Neolewinella lacunae]MDN3633646.1 DinB family protein [Neolewinella lacunae]
MQARNTADLLAALTRRTEENLAVARSFLALDSATLHLRPRPDAWNALECLAHLNHYGDYYLPEIRRQMATTRHRGAAATFTSSWLGNKFAAGMKPGPAMRKISTFRSANPQNFSAAVGLPAVVEFIRQQEDLLDLLRLAAQVDLTRTKTGISISRLIRLRLGDTLRVVVYHNWRHILQAQAAIAG